jgi:YXWGXW repeat-containing protein
MMNLRNLLLACALGGAVAAGAAIPAAAQVYGGVYVQTAPPAPIYETVPSAPGPGYYWVPGYWTWNGYRYVWRHGYYAYPPYSGARWVPGHWAHGPYGYYWKPGHWSHRYY